MQAKLLVAAKPLRSFLPDGLTSFRPPEQESARVRRRRWGLVADNFTSTGRGATGVLKTARLALGAEAGMNTGGAASVAAAASAIGIKATALNTAPSSPPAGQGPSSAQSGADGVRKPNRLQLSSGEDSMWLRDVHDRLLHKVRSSSSIK